MKYKNTKDILFKVISGIILFVFGIGFMNMLDISYILDLSASSIYSFAMIILIPAYFISIILFMSYLNRYRSDKWILLPVWITTMIIVFSVLYYVIRYIERPNFNFLILAILYFLLLPGNLYTTYNFKNNYRYNTTNYIIFGIMISISLIISVSPEPEPMLYIFVGILISFLYLSLSKKGYDDFIDRGKVCHDLQKAKELLEQNIITQAEYENIRSKWIKYL
jgi:hypothetical protein